jgi:hypothetical protein
MNVKLRVLSAGCSSWDKLLLHRQLKKILKNQIEEVVMVGFGQKKRKELMGAGVLVSGKSIMQSSSSASIERHYLEVLQEFKLVLLQVSQVLLY